MKELKNIRQDVRNLICDPKYEVFNSKKPSEWSEKTIKHVFDVHRDLWAAYRADGNDYGYNQKIRRIVYALFYYPLYVDPIGLVLGKLPPSDFSWALLDKNRLEEKKTLRVAVVGAGPGPEIYGLLRLIRFNRHHNLENSNEDNSKEFSFEIDAYDRAPEWADVFNNVTLELIKKSSLWKKALENGNLKISPKKINVPAEKLKGTYDLIIFQHFLNEFDKSNNKIDLQNWLSDTFKNNLNSGGLVTVIERGINIKKNTKSHSLQFVERLNFSALKTLLDGQCELKKEYDKKLTSVKERYDTKIVPRPPCERIHPSKNNEYCYWVYQKPLSTQP